MGVRPISGGFSGAIVAQVEAPSGSFCLRGWPPQSLSGERLSELHRLLNHWRHSGLPVAVPIPVHGSRETFTAHAGRWWQMEPWLPGRAVAPREISDEQLNNLMRTLAELHQSASRYSCRPESRSLFGVGSGGAPAVNGRRRLIADWTPTRLVEGRESLKAAPGDFRDVGLSILDGFLRCAERIDDELAACTDFVVAVHPCWRDIWNEHVLFSGSHVTGLVDPGSARTDHVSSDLSRILGSLLPDDFGRWNDALDTYSEGRPLKPEEYRLVRVMDRSSVLLSGMTWIERWQAGEIDPSQLEKIVDRVRIIVQRLRRMVVEFG